nr:hypothetical protein [Tanacetum cinerariifolium]
MGLRTFNHQSRCLTWPMTLMFNTMPFSKKQHRTCLDLLQVAYTNSTYGQSGHIQNVHTHNASLKGTTSYVGGITLSCGKHTAHPQLDSHVLQMQPQLVHRIRTITGRTTLSDSSVGCVSPDVGNSGEGSNVIHNEDKRLICIFL